VFILTNHKHCTNSNKIFETKLIQYRPTYAGLLWKISLKVPGICLKNAGDIWPKLYSIHNSGPCIKYLYEINLCSLFFNKVILKISCIASRRTSCINLHFICFSNLSAIVQHLENMKWIHDPIRHLQHFIFYCFLLSSIHLNEI